MHQGYVRVCAMAPVVAPAAVEANVDNICATVRQALSQKSDIDIFVAPEMAVTGYTCADLFHNSTLLDAAEGAVEALCRFNAAEMAPGQVLIVGVPVRRGATLYNCAAVICGGHVAGYAAKTYIPNYNEFYEARWWASAEEALLTPGDVPMGNNLLFRLGALTFGIEICEDLWAPVPASTSLALSGAEVVFNLSASDDLIGKYDYLRSLILNQSSAALCGYVYASAGFGESTTDLVFDAKLLTASRGVMLSTTQRWVRTSQWTVSDIDIEAIRRDRLHYTTFEACARRHAIQTVTVDLGQALVASDFEAVPDTVTVPAYPFVPGEAADLAGRCEEIINIQVAGLCRRLEATHCASLTIGISGGLDSTLALLVAVRAFDKIGLDRKGIIGVTMPGFGTTDRTHDNAVNLMQQLGVTQREISIVPAVNQHFSDIGHDPAVHDVTYENSQARERTQILMDIANQTGGMVLGTGDLSELALGWATYNGDHMSMYGVNSSVPKTLVRHLTRYFADHLVDTACQATLHDIIDTPISPELIPADADGNIVQKTEDLVGPYDLHDFFLYYTLRYGFTPRRIYALALRAFEGHEEFTPAVIARWLQIFFRRFFTQQFKRSCLPDGPKVGSVCLSPRGDWRMPSDASSELWARECRDICRQAGVTEKY